MDWWVMRLATSHDLSDTLTAITREWSFADQLHAHMTLDALDDVRALQRPDPPRTRTG